MSVINNQQVIGQQYRHQNTLSTIVVTGMGRCAPTTNNVSHQHVINNTTN